MTNIHRRALLKSSLPALAGAIATGAVANELVDTETPVQRLYAEWAKLGNRYGDLIDENDALLVRLKAEGNPDAFGLSEDHSNQFIEPLCTEFLAIEDKIMEIPAQDFKDLAIKARISARQDGVIDDRFNGLIREDAERLLGYVNI